jgi:serine/threonine-protein kinase
VKLDVPTLNRLSPLLDEALELDHAQREVWLSKLQGEQADLLPILRELLTKQASVETNDILQRGPDFTAPGQPTQATDFKAGDAVGPYRLIRELGRGGMGEVWLAERADGVLKRAVAMKLPILSQRRSILAQRFERERDILAALTHPNIARL